MQCLLQQFNSNGLTKDFDLNKYSKNSSKGCVVEIDFRYTKELCELRKDYPLAPDKIEIKRNVV